MALKTTLLYFCIFSMISLAFTDVIPQPLISFMAMGPCFGNDLCNQYCTLTGYSNGTCNSMICTCEGQQTTDKP